MRLSACLLALLVLGACQKAAPAPPQYAVVLLAGQSNMSGRGTGADPLALAAPDTRLLMWDGIAIVPARDPLPHQDLGQRAIGTGPGMSFARHWLARARPGQHVVLVPAAFGGTGFSDARGSWRVDTTPASPLAIEAVSRANAALRRLGPGARIEAILWHQGETDGANGMPAVRYAAKLRALAAYLRANIQGAGVHTPFLAGQYVPAQMSATPALAAIAAVNRALPATIPNSACVSSEGLQGNAAPDGIHFDAASQRAMGQRYAAALAALAIGATAPPCN